METNGSVHTAHLDFRGTQVFVHPRKPRGSQSQKGQFLKYRTPSEARPRAVRPKADPRAPGDILQD